MEDRQFPFKFNINTKWVSTVASIWIQCTSGSLYTFSIYSQNLKSTQHYDQSTLDLVSVFKDIGANVGILSGLLYDLTANSIRLGVPGPWLVHLAGATQCFLGYFLMWAAVAGVIPRLPVPAMCLFMFVAAHAQVFFNTSNVVTGVRNFPNFSGTIVGILKGFLGLSGAILIQVYQTVFNDNATLYLLMLALIPSINALLLLWFVKVHGTQESNDRRHLNNFSLTALVVATYLMAVIIVENVLSLGLSVRMPIFVLLILLLASPLYVAIRAQNRGLDYIYLTSSLHEGNQLMNESSQLDAVNAGVEEKSTNYCCISSSTNQDMGEDDQSALQRGEHLNLLQAMSTMNFWILFFAMGCGMGSGLATVNNIGQIGRSLGYKSYETGTLVSLWSIWNFLGRFGAGYVSDYMLHSRGWARPLFMVITLGGMSIGHVVIASGLPGGLYAGSILIGVFYGSQWSLMPTITSEIFGVGHMGTIFNTVTIANPVGSYFFSVRVVGYIYDKEVSGGNTCIGTHCFMLSFLVMAAATLFGSLAAFCLFLRTKSLYKEVILRRLLQPSRE